MKAVEEEIDYFEVEVLSPADRFNELILTGLRTIYGVSIRQLSEIQDFPKGFSENVEQLKSQGWMEEKSDRLYLTPEGRLRADFIASELFIVQG